MALNLCFVSKPRQANALSNCWEAVKVAVEKESWFKLHRSIIDSNVFENPDILKVWIWIMCKANFKESNPIIGNKTVRLEPGQMIFGRNIAAAELQMTPSKCYRIVNVLQECGNIEIKANNKFSVITVINWGFFSRVNR